jgi:phosphatidylserine/phosphatidylglycerophosphate/cardiolipin synthase-like enzyme
MYNLSSIRAKILVICTLVLVLGCENGVVEKDPEDVQVYFSPKDPCDEKVIALINTAVQELNIAVYSFNRLAIADAVIAAYQRGVAVRVITDADQAEPAYSKDEYLEEKGIPLIRVTHPGYGSMHNKFAVIDSRIVITGSYNWTTNATVNNNENLVVITSRTVAEQYNAEFETIWTEHG